MSTQWNTIPCICGSTQTTRLGEKDGRFVGSCDSCGIIRTPLIPEDYGTLYTDGDRYHTERQGQIPYRERYEHDVAVGLSRLDVLRDVRTPRLLDIGCANGGFLTAARANGFAVEGLELNPSMARWAEDASYAQVHTSWDSVRPQFDVITMHDVLEHTTDPAAELFRLRQYMTANGYLVIDVPDGGHCEFVASPMTSRHMKPVEHLWFFRENDLRRVLAAAGLVVQAVDRPIPGKLVLYSRVNHSYSARKAA